MKILVNCSSLNSSGPNQVARSFLIECKGIANDYHVIVGPSFSKWIDTSLFPSNFTFYLFESRIVSGIKSFFQIRARLKGVEKKVKPDVVFTLFGPSLWRPKAKHIQGFATAHVLYSDSQYFKLISLKKRLWWYLYSKLNLFLLKYESDAVILETNIFAQRLNKKIPYLKTYVVSNIFSDVYLNFINEKSISRVQDGFFKLLTLSSYKRHKNLEIIPSVIDELRSMGVYNIRFFLTLTDQKYKEIIPARYREIVSNLGPLQPEECPDAYRNVDAMFLPTLLEVFSASYPEAMVMARPILTSNYDFATSVCGDAAIYFNPVDAKSIADSIHLLASDLSLYNSLVEAGKQQVKLFGNASSRANAYLKILKEHV